MDKQGRIIIPSTLIEFVGLSVDTQIALCWLNDLTFYIANLNQITDEDKVLEVRKIDAKGRIFISKAILKKFNIALSACPFVYAKGGIIYLSFD